MPLISGGPTTTRPRRASLLQFGWRASDGTLDAYTGQVGVMSANASASGSITGVNGVIVTAGRFLPRFTTGVDGVTRLRIQGDAAGVYDENVEFPWGPLIQPTTVYVRLRSMYTLASGGIADPGNFAFQIGTSTTQGGRLTIARSTGGVWRARRLKLDPSGGSLLLTATETGAWVHPFDLLLKLNADGSITFIIRDGGGTERFNSTSAADTDLILSELWGGMFLTFGSAFVVGGERGGDFDYEAVKVRAGSWTLDQMIGAA